MKFEEVQELLTNNGVEITESINIDEISKGINTFATGLKESSVEKALKNVDGNEFVNKFLTENDFENVDQFNAFIKNSKASTNELQEKATRLENEAVAYQSKISELESTAFNQSVGLAFSTNGVTDTEIIKDFTPIIKNNLTEGKSVEEVTKEVIGRYKIGQNNVPKIGGNPGGGAGKEMSIADKINKRINK